MVMARFDPAPKLRRAGATFTSVPLDKGLTEPPFPGFSVSVPPAVLTEPGLKMISPPDVRFTLAALARLTGALTVIGPLLALPILSVPVVIWPIELPERPRVP